LEGAAIKRQSQSSTWLKPCRAPAMICVAIGVEEAEPVRRHASGEHLAMDDGTAEGRTFQNVSDAEPCRARRHREPANRLMLVRPRAREGNEVVLQKRHLAAARVIQVGHAGENTCQGLLGTAMKPPETLHQGHPSRRIGQGRHHVQP
jgi:hypothetical protein